jgi:hypothetical protein
VDTGYVDASLLVSSPRDYQIELIGPTRANYRWQARQKTGFDASQFVIDWHAEQATCPEGHRSLSWTPAIDNRKNEVIKIKFSRHRLSSLSQPETLYAIDSSCASDGDDPTAGTVPCLAEQAATRTNAGV